MTVTTPPFVFPHTFDSSTARDNCYPPYSSSGQRQYGHRAERPHSDTESSAYGNYSHNPVDAISNASERMLESNGHFLRARMVAEQKTLETARLQEVLDTYKKENDDLKIEVKTLKESLALFANDYHEGSQTTGLILRTTRSGNVPAKPTPPKREDVLSVCHWTRKEFRRACVAHANTQRGETDGDATSTRGNGKRGRPRKGSDKDNQPTHFYLENADGVPVSEEQISEMSRKARMLWRSLDSDGMAPPTFGQISMRAWEYYSSVMLADEAFNFLLLCDDGEWKLREWSTRSYPSWYRNRFTKDIEDEIESDSIRSSAPASNRAGTGDHPTDVSQKDDNATGIDSGAGAGNSDDAEELNVDNNLNETARRPEATEIQEVSRPSGSTTTETSARSAPLLVDPFAADSAPPALTDQAPPGIEAAGSSSDIPIPPSTHDSDPSNSPCTSTPPSSGTGGLSTQAFTSSVAFQETPTPSMAVPGPQSTEATGPGHNHSNALAPTPQALPVRIRLRLNPTEATESNKRKPNAEPPTSSAKKQKIANPLAEPTTANSIRNICMRHWKRAQPDGQGLLRDFDNHFKSLSDLDKEPFKVEMRAAQVAARKVKTAAKKANAP